ncbi:MAG: hypothetical protein KatS3mg102_2877 [Planctomycetota bacterium]|nr:MAG: hypothetical protein KatS3mg102_2877 [Planctomycetota bacterium]
MYQLGEWMALPGDAALDEDVRQRWEADPYRRYGFAFIVRPTVGPDADNPDPDRRRQPVVPGLYEVTVMVYRNFLPEQESRFNDPIATFVTYVAAQ